MAQADPTAPSGAPASAPNIDVHVDLSGLAGLIWQWLLDHFDQVATVALQWFEQHIGEIGTAIWTALENVLRDASMAVWNATFGALGHILGQLPPEWTYGLPAYRAIATDPLPVATGGAMLALVLLGLRTTVGSMLGYDHVITHVMGRLIPAVFLTLAYPALIGRGINLLNGAAGSIGDQAVMATLVEFPQAPAVVGGRLAFAILWLLLLWYALRLLLRVAYSLFRFLVALVFGPVALMLWAIPQTEWVTSFWLRELVGWATTPLLVAVCLSVALPMATGRGGFLAAAAFGIAGLQAAYDLVGLLALGHGHGGRVFPIPFASVRLGSGSGALGGGAGIAAASVPANRLTTLAEMYGFD